MGVRQWLGVAVLGLVLSLSGGAGLPVGEAMAQDGPVSIRQALEAQVGKRAKLKLVSGQDLEGKVVKVGDEVVVVQELTGMEYFGATVRLDQVAAVIVRTSNP